MSAGEDRPRWAAAVVCLSPEPSTVAGFVAVEVDAFDPAVGSGWRRPDDYELRVAGCRWTVGPGHLTCRRPPAAMLARSRHGSPLPAWWAYCAEHLYGRRLDPAGRLLERRLLAERWAAHTYAAPE